jgi:hypothetical protein
MAKINYMDDKELVYEPSRAAKVAELLFRTLNDLGNSLLEAKDY